MFVRLTLSARAGYEHCVVRFHILMVHLLKSDTLGMTGRRSVPQGLARLELPRRVRKDMLCQPLPLFRCGAAAGR